MRLVAARDDTFPREPVQCQGTPSNRRQMDGFGVYAFKMVNAAGDPADVVKLLDGLAK